MRHVLMIVPLLALAACATPREQCISNVTRDARVLATLISETQGNLARGYALEQQQELRTVRTLCRGRDAQGNSFSFACNESETINTTVPVAIDLNAERAKLASLQERQAQAQAAADRGVAQCIAVHPE